MCDAVALGDVLLALQQVQAELDGKLDKSEIYALKDFINCKLHSIQEQLKVLSRTRKGVEAAGAKIKFLTNVNCISCDAEVVMRREAEGAPPKAGLPAKKSMAPYISYELDQLRKDVRQGPGRNMNNFVDAAQEDRKSQAMVKRSEATEDELCKTQHLCNRYCGGSHTLTTPQQRVTRVGHFLQEFGPQVVSLMQTREQKRAPGEALSPSDLALARCLAQKGALRDAEPPCGGWTKC